MVVTAGMEVASKENISHGELVLFDHYSSTRRRASSSATCKFLCVHGECRASEPLDSRFSICVVCGGESVTFSLCALCVISVGHTVYPSVNVFPLSHIVLSLTT